MPAQHGAVEVHGVWSQMGPDSDSNSVLQASGLRLEVLSLSASMSSPEKMEILIVITT